METNFILKNPKEHHALGLTLGRLCLGKNVVIFLQGELGAGKTTLARGILAGLGHSGKVKSPTYALIETYILQHPDTQSAQHVCHVDLYRIHSSKEIIQLGLQDYAQISSNENVIYLIEWPERGLQELPKPDITCYIAHLKNKRSCRLVSQSAEGQNIILALSQSKEQ